MRRVALLFTLIVGTACATGSNYVDTSTPRYAGAPATPLPPHASDTLRLVTFNIAYAVRVDSALALFAAEPDLRNADILLLQEMDEAGTRRMAEALHMWYVYYPSTLRFKTDRDFGNAVLSRWPIVADAKLVLPHVARINRTQRTATAATIRIRNADIRVYSTHLATVAEVRTAARRDQLRTIITDAARFERVIIGGDMNDPRVGGIAREHGYAWITQEGPRTAIVGRLDHIFVKGLAVPDSGAAGTITNVREASDHRPVWGRIILSKS